jgi:hypothetical protein
MRRSIAAEREHRLRRLRRHDHEFDSSLRHAGFRLERIKIVADPRDIGRTVRFWNHDGIDARAHDSDKIVNRKASVERVDPHEKPPVALVAPVDEFCDVIASEGLLRGGDRIFEIEDQRVGAAVVRTRELALGVARDEQERPQFHTSFRGRSLQLGPRGRSASRNGRFLSQAQRNQNLLN